MGQVLTVEQPCRLELDCPEGVPVPGRSALDLLKYLFSVRGKSVLDLGCGPGLFAVASARLGAREVWATDPSPAAIEATRNNARRNGVEVTAKSGDLFEAVADRSFDMIIALPPHLPAPAGTRSPRVAGVDGLLHFEEILREAPEHLERGGELLTSLSSLAETRRFEALLAERFRYRALPRTRREFAREDCDGILPGLFQFLCERRERGLADFDEEDGRRYVSVRTYLAMKL